MAITLTQRVNLGGSSSYNPGVVKYFSIGMTQRGRRIMYKKFKQDHILTKIEFEVISGKFLSAETPAVLRVYQFGYTADARFLALSGLGTFSTEITLNVTNRDTNRMVIVDA